MKAQKKAQNAYIATQVGNSEGQLFVIMAASSGDAFGKLVEDLKSKHGSKKIWPDFNTQIVKIENPDGDKKYQITCVVYEHDIIR